MNESQQSSADRYLANGTTSAQNQPRTEMDKLIEAIESQTKAIGELVAVNQRVLQAMLEEPEDGDQGQPGGYLNG